MNRYKNIDSSSHIPQIFELSYQYTKNYVRFFKTNLLYYRCYYISKLQPISYNFYLENQNFLFLYHSSTDNKSIKPSELKKIKNHIKTRNNLSE